MKHDREFWTRHCESRRTSGLSQRAYCARRRLAKGSLGRPTVLSSQLLRGGTCFVCGPRWTLRTCAMSSRCWSVADDRAAGQRGAGVRAAGAYRHEEADQRAGADRRAGHGGEGLRAGTVFILQRGAAHLEGVVLGSHRVLPLAKDIAEGSLPWPRSGEPIRVEIDAARLRMLLDGIDFWSAHQPLNYQRVS